MEKRFPNLLVHNEGFVGFVSALLQSVGLMPELFLHRRVGEFYHARWWHALIAALITCAVFHRHEPLPLFYFAVAYAFICIMLKVICLWRRWRGGPVTHSRYSGEPWIKKLLPNVSETTIKQLEPLFVALIGYGIAQLNMLLGVFLMVCALGWAWSNLLNGRAAYLQAVALNDAVCEQEFAAERFRNLRGEPTTA